MVEDRVNNLCAIGNVLTRLTYNKGSRRDIELAVAALTRRPEPR